MAKNIYTVTLRRPNGTMSNYNVLATDGLTGTDEDPSAVAKAQAKMLADDGVAGSHYSGPNTLAENVLE